ncbi:MAG: hypothetical protein ACFE89_06695 [Candidatus Hodarchaeota archaeon]
MQALHITETRAIVPVTRKLTEIRFSLEDLIGSAASVEDEPSGSSRRRLSNRRIGQLLPNAVLQCQKASSEFIELNLTYDRTIKIPVGRPREFRYQVQTYTVTSEILWRPETGFCFIMDLPRSAVKATTWMLSSAVLGYPGRLSSLDIGRTQMRKVISFITAKTKGGPGELLRAIFRNVELDGNYLDEVSLRARDLNKADLYKDVQQNAGSIHAVSFATPIIPGIDRPLACRMDSSGSVLVYSQRLQSDALRAFLLWLEEMLAK